MGNRLIVYPYHIELSEGIKNTFTRGILYILPGIGIDSSVVVGESRVADDVSSDWRNRRVPDVPKSGVCVTREPLGTP